MIFLKAKKKYLAVFLLFVSQIALAQSISTDRPGQSDASTVLSKKDFQIESGFTFWGDLKQATIQNSRWLMPTTLFRYGMGERIEARLLTQVDNVKIASKSKTGISDIELGTKIQAVKSERVQLAVIAHLSIPTGTEGFTNEVFGYVVKTSLSYQLSNNVSIGTNTGYVFFNEGNFFYTVPVGFSISDKLGTFVEVYGNVDVDKNHFYNFDTGLAYLLNDNLQLDCAFGLGINNSAYYIGVGISWRKKG